MQAALEAAPPPTIDTSRALRPRRLTPVVRAVLVYALRHPTTLFTQSCPLLAALRRARNDRRAAYRQALRRAYTSLCRCNLLTRSPLPGAPRYQLARTFEAATLAARLVLTGQED